MAINFPNNPNDGDLFTSNTGVAYVFSADSGNVWTSRGSTITLTANSAFDQANTARTHANGAFDQANTARTHANGAFANANSAGVIAIAAFAKANVGAIQGNSVVFISSTAPTTNLSNGSLWWNSNDGSLYIYYNDSDSAQWIITVGGLLEASNASIIAVSAFDAANGAFDAANGAFGAANGAVLKTGNTMTGNLIMSGANIAFTTVTNSGIYWGNSESTFIHSPAANTLVFGTTSSEDMRIDITGNVSISTRFGIGVASPRSKFDIIGAAAGQITTLTDAATITPDFSSNNSFSVTLGGNRTLANATNTTIGQSGAIYIIQDGTGSRTLSFGLAYKFVDNSAPTLTTTANAVDVIIYSVRTANSYVCQSLLNVGNRNDT